MLLIMGIAIFVAVKLVWGFDGEFDNVSSVLAQPQETPTELLYYIVVDVFTFEAVPTIDIVSIVAAEIVI
jgi:hypothetical protein